MYTALRATSLTLTDFILQGFLADPSLTGLFDGSGAVTYVISLGSPQEMIDRTQQGISAWLYWVERDAERVNAPPQRISYNELRNPPLPLRLHYLITPVLSGNLSSIPETEQVLLGKVMQILYDHPFMRGADLRDTFTGTDIELQVRLETVGLEGITGVFDALDQPFQLSVSYEVSVVMIETALQPEIGPPVQEVLAEHGVIVG